MHMADALLSPAVGGTMWAASAGAIVYCSAKVHKELDGRMTPLMGVLGAFLFAAQMINFTIPATGSSGHLNGGLLLTILLGPHAAFLAIASVLVVQALFFADGGLLALGCNIFNMGFFPAFIVYPFIYKNLIGGNPSQTRLTVVTIVAAIIGLQLGSFGIVLETLCSGISALPFSTFVLLMQPIHLAIGIVEGFVTASVVAFMYQARPEVLRMALGARPIGHPSLRNILLAFLIVTVLTGGVVSGFASKNPDGLEWAMGKTMGMEELKSPSQGIHSALAAVQGWVVLMPHYTFKLPDKTSNAGQYPDMKNKVDTGSESPGAGVAGVVGGMMTLAITLVIGLVLKKRARPF